jgi:hypothetical protein
MKQRELITQLLLVSALLSQIQIQLAPLSPTTPGTVRKGLLLANSVLAEADETWNLRENRTIGGLMVGIEMRGEADGIRWWTQLRLLWRLMIPRVTVMRTVTREEGKDGGRCRAV